MNQKIKQLTNAINAKKTTSTYYEQKQARIQSLIKRMESGDKNINPKDYSIDEYTAAWLLADFEYDEDDKPLDEYYDES